MTDTNCSESRINLREYAFPEVTKVDMAFPTFAVPDDLLAEARARGFGRSGPYTKLFGDIFYSGRNPKPRSDLDDSDAEWMAKLWSYTQVLMASWASKHQHKEAVVAMLLSEIADPEPAPVAEKGEAA